MRGIDLLQKLQDQMLADELGVSLDFLLSYKRGLEDTYITNKVTPIEPDPMMPS